MTTLRVGDWVTVKGQQIPVRVVTCDNDEITFTMRGAEPGDFAEVTWFRPITEVTARWFNDVDGWVYDSTYTTTPEEMNAYFKRLDKINFDKECQKLAEQISRVATITVEDIKRDYFGITDDTPRQPWEPDCKGCPDCQSDFIGQCMNCARTHLLKWMSSHSFWRDYFKTMGVDGEAWKRVCKAHGVGVK